MPLPFQVPKFDRSAGRGRFASRLDGVQATLEVLKKYENEAPEIMDGVMGDWIERVRDQAVALAPESLPEEVKIYGPPTVEHGFLKSTGNVVHDGPMQWSVVFTAWYAIYVHEINRHHTVGQWQFLSTAVAMVMPEMGEELGFKFSSEMFGRSSTGRGFFRMSESGGSVVSSFEKWWD